MGKTGREDVVRGERGRGNRVERLIPWAHDVNRRYIKRRGRLLNV